MGRIEVASVWLGSLFVAAGVALVTIGLTGEAGGSQPASTAAVAEQLSPEQVRAAEAAARVRERKRERRAERELRRAQAERERHRRRIARALDESRGPVAGGSSRLAGTGNYPDVDWRGSRAIGEPNDGRLVNGVLLPAEGRHFFTWDDILRRTPNREDRRWGTDRLVLFTLRVVDEFARAHPEAPRLAVGDLSRPRGGGFGARYGGLGHLSHQNGLDVDFYYPRTDGRETQVESLDQVDRELAQDLLDRVIASGAGMAIVDARLELEGPSDVVEQLPHHDDHMHVRIPRDWIP